MGFRNKRTGKRLSEDIKAQEKEFKKLLKKIPGKMVELAQEMIDENFQNESYDGKSKWAGRKKDKESSKTRSNRRALLVLKGELIADVTAFEEGNKVIMGTNMVYGERHNEGKKMPKRQFMPIPGEAPPESFNKKVESYIDSQMDKIFN